MQDVAAVLKTGSHMVYIALFVAIAIVRSLFGL